MKWFFKFFLAIHKGLYRLSGGRIGGEMQGAKVMLLYTTGRKTGKQRVTPLMFIREGNSYVVTASNAGQPSHPGWYWNIQDGAPIEIQIMDKKLTVEAHEAEGEKRIELFERFKNVSDQYSRYDENTDRDIPVVILTPIAS